MTQYSSDSAAEQGLASCQSCGKLSTVSNKFCRRCRAPLHLRKPYNIQKTLALLITALMFYIPANLGYGDISPSPKIPINSTLIFEIELLKIKKEDKS